MKYIYHLIGAGLLPDFVIRRGIRKMLEQKLVEFRRDSPELKQEKLNSFIEELKSSAIALYTDKANTQHYELPSEFFQAVLGHRLKYSCGYWDEIETEALDWQHLNLSEDRMLDLYLKRAEIGPNQRVLDLGCGWGSFSLYAASKFSNSHFTALSNSRVQREFILNRATKLSLSNLEVITGNIAEIDMNQTFDRIVSIEMFEHMKNYELLLNKLSNWLESDGKLFVHIFTHKEFAYHYENKDGNDWLTEHFFTGGTMPSNDLLLYFQNDLKLEKQWLVDGRHYRNTSNAWLVKMDSKRDELIPLFESTYGVEESQKWWNYWRLFFLACAELWGYEKGSEWMVSHYLFSGRSKIY